MQLMVNISVIIPAYNEEKRLGQNLAKILAFLNMKRYNYEVIIVNDASTDGTAGVAEDFRKKNKRVNIVNLRHKKAGNTKGLAVKQGMLHAKYDLALFTDSDKSTPITELDKLMRFIDDYDVVIGSRSIKGANVKVHQPFLRELMGKIFNKIVRILTVKGIVDTQCGFKLFRDCRQLFRKQLIMGWAFDVELLFLAQKSGKKIKEVPVVWINDPNTKVHAIRSAIQMFQQVLQVRMNWMLGKYR